MGLGAPVAVSGCVCVAVSVWVGVWVCGVWGRIFGCCCMFGFGCVRVMEGGVSLLGSVNNTFRGTAVPFHRLFQVENCFQNPEMAARLSPASCRAVGRTRLSGRVADRPSACRDPRPTLWPLTPARHRPPGPDCRDVFRNN